MLNNFLQWLILLELCQTYYTIAAAATITSIINSFAILTDARFYTRIHKMNSFLSPKVTMWNFLSTVSVICSCA